nr:long-chain acyl-CoA synthetase 6 [Tanacetum cinerariifolium]
MWIPGGRLKIIDSFNSCLVAIVSVDPDVLKAWAAKEGLEFSSWNPSKVLVTSVDSLVRILDGAKLA